jgi:S-formylglutathione hydrolase FrmB
MKVFIAVGAAALAVAGCSEGEKTPEKSEWAAAYLKTVAQQDEVELLLRRVPNPEKQLEEGRKFRITLADRTVLWVVPAPRLENSVTVYHEDGLPGYLNQHGAAAVQQAFRANKSFRACYMLGVADPTKPRDPDGCRTLRLPSG